MKALNVLLALLVSAAIALGVVEVGLRAIGFAPTEVNTEFDPDLGWRKTPGKTIERSTGEYDVTLTTDAAGLRDDYDAAPLAPAGDDTFRAVFLGDSFVVGYTVDREDLFVDQLERAWSAEGRGVEVMNAGTQGYSSDQSLRWLELNGAAAAPDLVVYFAYENDIWWNGSPEYLGQDKPLYDDRGALVERPLAEPAPRSWFRSFAMGEAWYRLVSAPRIPTVTSGDITLPVEMSSRLVDPPAATLHAEQTTRALIGRMAAECERLGSRFAVCPIPSKAQVASASATTEAGARIDPSRPQRIFIEAAREAGAMVIDPTVSIRSFAADAEPYYRRDFHLNPSGNVALATALYGALGGADAIPPVAADATPALPVGREASGGAVPRWLLWYLGLTTALGLLYTRTYPQESALTGFGSVAALLAVVFGTALGVTSLVAALPPQASQLTVLGLLLTILTFVLYKLGDRVGTIAELLRSFTLRGHWYLMPLLSVLLSVGSLLVVAASSPLVAPFIYTLF
jgi:lysophospholipase L1-like esterase